MKVAQSPWNSPGQNTRVGSLSLLQGIFPTQGLNPSFLLQADSLPAEPQGKSKNTGVGSLFLLQGIFPTQESNQGFLHCRQILYHSSSGKKAQANIAMTVKKGLIFLMIEKAKVTKRKFDQVNIVKG